MRRTLLGAIGALLVAWSVTGAAPVLAQGAGVVVVIPAIVGEAHEEDALFERSAAIRKGASPNVRSTAATARAVERKASVPPKRLLPEELERWLSHQEKARQQLTLSNYTRAAVSLRAAQDISEEAIEALNREASRARKVLDTCLYLVRSLWETGQTDRAEEQARACRQLVPSIEPTLGLHTPDVRGVLHRVDEARRQEAAVRLEVESPRSGCLVRINGLHLGETPFSIGELLPGEYRVQVECEENRPGRVHRVNLERDETVYIDPTLDAALELKPEVHLAYVSDEVMAGHADNHGRWLARMLGVQTVLLVEAERVVRVDRDAGVVGAVEAKDDEDARLAAVTLLAYEIAESEGASSRVGRRGDGLRDDGRARRVFGGVQAAVGVAAVVTGVGLYAWRVKLGNRFQEAEPGTPEFAQARDAWEDARLGVLLAAPLGSVLAASGFAFAYKPRTSVPWWAWTAGGIGAGLLGWGIASMVIADRCPADVVTTPACVPGQQDMDRGVLLLSMGVPLVFMPAWALGRRADVQVSANGAGLTVKGTF
jgi:hypothetical protein